MNKTIIILLVATTGFWACDTKDSIAPLNDSFFVKLYAGISEGDQFGEDIIATSDGGLLIAATSRNTDGSSEILLIKTDEKGNELWTYGASADLAEPISVAKSVIELPGSYLVGGTLGEGAARRSILIKISFDGAFMDSETVLTDDAAGTPFYNQLSKITLGHSGILVSGETDHPQGEALKINGFIGLFDEIDLDSIPSPLNGSSYKQYFGLGEDEIITGAYEVLDTTKGAVGNEIRFVAFGSSTNVLEPLVKGIDFFLVDFTIDYRSLTGIKFGQISEDGNQTSAYVTRAEDIDDYWMIGETQNPGPDPKIFLAGWKLFSNWAPIPGNEEASNSKVSGKGVSVQIPGEYVITGDNTITSDHTEIYLSRVNSNRDIIGPWPKTYGADAATYSSSAVITLQDGSIVMLGTADLQPIQKVLVIKTGPNGEMSF